MAIGSECYRFSSLEALSYIGIWRGSQKLYHRIRLHRGTTGHLEKVLSEMASRCGEIRHLHHYKGYSSTGRKGRSWFFCSSFLLTFPAHM